MLDVWRKTLDYLYHTSHVTHRTSYVTHHTSHVSPPNSHFIRHNPCLLPCRRVPLRQFLHGLRLDFDEFHLVVWDFMAEDADPRFFVLLQRRIEGQRDLLGQTVFSTVFRL